MNKITVIFTCFNRKEKTVTCMNTITSLNPKLDFSFLVVDDASTDGTVEAIKALEMDTKIIKGTGSLFWCGGMRIGIADYLASCPPDDDFCLLVNDDVNFVEHSIEDMIDRLAGRSDTIIVGATCGTDGKFTYGLKKREKWYKKNITMRIPPSDEEVEGETGNANCVLVRNNILKDVGNMDQKYTHSLGDYDWGFEASRKGYHLISSNDFVGTCDSNTIEGTWNDCKLSRRERLKKKESPKGSPAGEWWHFVYKNFGLMSAIKYSIIPYAKIMLRK